MTNLVDAIIRSLDEEPEKWSEYGDFLIRPDWGGVDFKADERLVVRVCSSGDVVIPVHCKIARDDTSRLRDRVHVWWECQRKRTINVALAALNGKTP